MYTYTINLALNGFHYAKVMLSMNMEREDAIAAHRKFCMRFKPEDGWSITLTRWNAPIGEDIAREER